MDMTASFLPKPVTGVNGNGMHTNISLAAQGQEPVPRQEGRGRPVGAGLGLHRAHPRPTRVDICLVLNPSVNAYRRLDPHFEAPNQIKASAIDRGSMVRIPLGNEKSARIEVRSVAPDANPYLTSTRCCAPARGPRCRIRRTTASAQRTRFLPDNIYDAIRLFKSRSSSPTCSARRSRRSSPSSSRRRPNAARKRARHRVKTGEVQFHHEVTNQYQLCRHYRTNRNDRIDLVSISVAALDPSIVGLLADREEMRLFLAALRELPLDLQVALELHYWEKCQVAEIAAALELPEGTVKSRLRRGRELLRATIDRLAARPDLATSTIQGMETWARDVRAQVRGVEA
jgi:RNA polymerase sigma factor (sigma-70 family)